MLGIYFLGLQMERKYNENIEVYSQREIVSIDKSNFTLHLILL